MAERASHWAPGQAVHAGGAGGRLRSRRPWVHPVGASRGGGRRNRQWAKVEKAWAAELACGQDAAAGREARGRQPKARRLAGQAWGGGEERRPARGSGSRRGWVQSEEAAREDAEQASRQSRRARSRKSWSGAWGTKALEQLG